MASADGLKIEDGAGLQAPEQLRPSRKPASNQRDPTAQSVLDQTASSFHGTIERIIKSKLTDNEALVLGRSHDGDAVLLRLKTEIQFDPGDVISAIIKSVRGQIDGMPPLFDLGPILSQRRPPRMTSQPDLAWILSLLETAPATQGLVAIVDPETLNTDIEIGALPAAGVDAEYHRLNARLMAQAVSSYWGPTDPVEGKAASPGAKHYGKLRSRRVRRSILVPYDSLVARTAPFHGFSLTGTRDIAPKRLLSARGDRILAMAHEAAHMLEPLVGIWPDQHHVSECFADSFAVLAVLSRADAALFADDLQIYRDMRLIALLYGDSPHATGIAVAETLARHGADCPAGTLAMAEAAFVIAIAAAGNKEILRQRRHWVDTARTRHGAMLGTRSDHAHLAACKALLEEDSGSVLVQKQMGQAIEAFDRIALSGDAARSDDVVEEFRRDLTMLTEEAGTRNRAMVALRRTRAALDRGLPPSQTHDLENGNISALVRLRTQILDEAEQAAQALPQGGFHSRSEPVVIHQRWASYNIGPRRRPHAKRAAILHHFETLMRRERQILADANAQCAAQRDLASAAAGRVLRERIDFCIEVASNVPQFRSVAAEHPAIAREILQLATAPVNLLVRHNDKGL